MIIDDYQRECSETRILPIGGGGNLIVGRQSYEREMRWRKQRIDDGVPFDLPAWNDLAIYQTNDPANPS
jgi:hypothetical protein